MFAFSVRLNSIEHAKQLCSVGVSREEADIHAQAVEGVIEMVLQTIKKELHSQELANQKDILILKKEIAEIRAELKKQ